MKKWLEYTKEYFEKCCMQEWHYYITPAKEWSDDLWYIDQENRDFILNEWYWIFNHGKAEGVIIWGHIPCMESIQWTSFYPKIQDNIIFFMEIDADFSNELFECILQSLIQQSFFSQIKWIVIWRFQKNNKMTKDLLKKIIDSKIELKNIPIIWNVDFWHTTPFFTFPIGWYWLMDTSRKKVINILKH